MYDERKQTMTNEESRIIKCEDCGEQLPQEFVAIKEKEDCPNCGSRSRIIQLGIADAISVKDSVKGKKKDINFNSKRNPRYKFFEGDEFSHSDQKWMKKTRVIDKDNDKYFEVVIDPDTNELVHFCEEPLSKHTGHGSDSLISSNLP